MALKRALFVLLAGVGCTAAINANATPLYFQGFETDTNGWVVSTGGDNDGAVTRTQSGGGSLGLTAFDGSYYAETRNDTNDYQLGYGTGGFSALGGDGINPTPYPGADFSQSISVYINTSTPAPTNPSVPAFWIDMTPSALTPDGVPGCGAAFACSDEHNFQLYYDGSDVRIGTDGNIPNLTITTSGWYTFVDTYAKGATPASLVMTDEDVFDASGNLLSSASYLGNSDGKTLASSNLGGPGYIWLPVWQNGFSNNLLGIDDVRADAVPEPPALALLVTALLGLGFVGYARRRSLRA